MSVHVVEYAQKCAVRMNMLKECSSGITIELSCQAKATLAIRVS